MLEKIQKDRSKSGNFRTKKEHCLLFNLYLILAILHCLYISLPLLAWISLTHVVPSIIILKSISFDQSNFLLFLEVVCKKVLLLFCLSGRDILYELSSTVEPFSFPKRIRKSGTANNKEQFIFLKK